LDSRPENSSPRFDKEESIFPELLPPPSLPTQDDLTQVREEVLPGEAESLPSQRIGEVIVFCVLALLGAGLFVLIALTDLLWIYPATFYGVVTYLAWIRYFSY
jgi:hypothetical protein